jgi:WD40 repeat protein
VEAFLRQHPALAQDVDALLDLIYNEWALREAARENLSLDEYVQRFPNQAGQLRMQWEVHAFCRAARREAAPTIASLSLSLPHSTASSPPPLAGDFPEIPGHEVLDTLGRGGMGIVYKARHLGLKRLVALKIPLAGFEGDPAEVLRFRREAEAAAHLQHPHLVQIHDVGTWLSRVGGPTYPFLSMEYVDGSNLAQYLRDGPLAPRDAATLIETLARAIHYAHERGIVHRDLKPANVLLAAERQTETPGQGETVPPARPEFASLVPKITDFGIAGRLDVDGSQTRTGTVLGTPSYMAPEQATGRTHAIGRATDVYALGAILYEILTGRPPFKGTTVLDTLEQVRLLEPVAPRRFQPKTPVDLETICLKCLAKEPPKRYATAEALADDLRRFLDDKPIQARPTPVWEQIWKAAKRRPGIAILLVLIVVVSLAGFTGVLSQWRRAEQVAEERRRAIYVLGANLVQQFLQRDDTPRAQEMLENLRPGPGQSDLRGFEWYYLHGLAHGDQLAVPGGECVAFTHDGRFIAAAGEEGAVIIWDRTGRQVAALHGHSDTVTAVAFSPDGKRLASTARDNTVKVWDWQAGRECLALPTQHTDWPLCLAFGGDGTTLATAGRDGAVLVWDLRTRTTRKFPGPAEGTGTCLAFSPKGSLLAFANTAEQVWLWDWQGDAPPRRIRSPQIGTVHGLTFSPDGRLLAMAGSNGSTELWDLVEGESFARLKGHTAQVSCLAISPDGTRLASGSWDRTIRLWEIPSGRDSPIAAPSVLRGHPGFVTGLSFDGEGRFLASAGSDRTVRLWDTQAQRPEHLLAVHRCPPFTCLVFSPDGQTLAAGNRDGRIRIFAGSRQEVVAEIDGHAKGIHAIAFNKTGSLLASASDDGTVKLWDVPSWQPLCTLQGHAAGVSSVAFSPTDALVASGSEDGTVRLWDIRTGQERDRFKGHAGAVYDVAFSPDGQQVASASQDHTVRIWNIGSGAAREPLLLGGHTNAVLRVVFSPDGEILASGGKDRLILLWDARRGSSLGSLAAHDGEITALAFHPSDHRRLASAGSDHLVRLWDMDLRQEVLSLAGLPQDTMGLAFRPDGAELAAAGSSFQRGQIKVWSVSHP